MKILFIGCVKSSEVFLHRLLDIKADVVGVVTKRESSFNSDFVDLGQICRENGLDYMYVRNVNDRDSKDFITAKKADIILCLGWSQIVDDEILALPPLGCVGFHPAMLPHNKGRHPLIWALALGLEETASTFFMMDAGADTGAIVSQARIHIEYEDDAASLYDRIVAVAADQLEKLMSDFANGTVTYVIQNQGEGNTWRKRGKEDGKIDWRMSSRGIYNLVRALTRPYIGAHFVFEDSEYKVWKVREIFSDEYKNIEPGKVIAVKSCRQFTVKAGDGLIEVLDMDKDIEIREGDYL